MTPVFKVCTKCGEAKPARAEFFSPDSRYRHGLTSWCRVCSRAYERSKKRVRVLTTEQKQRQKEATARYRDRHTEAVDRGRENALEWANGHLDRRRESSNDWRKRNLDRSAAAARNRRARKLESLGCHTAEDVSAQLSRQKGRCYYCQSVVNDYHVDHVIPLVKGGSNGPENLVIACPTCNMKKHDKHPMDFAGVMF